MENSTSSSEININHLNLLPDFVELKSFNYGNIDFRMIDIIKIEAKKSYSVFYIKGKEPYISPRNLTFQEKKLNSKYFFRATKSCLINFFQVEEIIKALPAVILMTDKSKVFISRRKTAHFLAMYKFFLFELNKIT